MVDVTVTVALPGTVEVGVVIVHGLSVLTLIDPSESMKERQLSK